MLVIVHSVRLMTIARSLPVLPCQLGFPRLQKNETGIWVSSPGWGGWILWLRAQRPLALLVTIIQSQ